jgi:hypothetical protein
MDLLDSEKGRRNPSETSVTTRRLITQDLNFQVTICTRSVTVFVFSTRFVSAFKAQRLLYVPPGLTLSNSTFCPHSVFMCFVWISEQTAIISLYSINWLVFITETECVYCAVRTEFLKRAGAAVEVSGSNPGPDTCCAQ